MEDNRLVTCNSSGIRNRLLLFPFSTTAKSICCLNYIFIFPWTVLSCPLFIVPTFALSAMNELRLPMRAIRPIIKKFTYFLMPTISTDFHLLSSKYSQPILIFYKGNELKVPMSKIFIVKVFNTSDMG